MFPLRPPRPSLPLRNDPPAARAVRAFAVDVLLAVAITLAVIGAGPLAWGLGAGHGMQVPPPLAWQAFIGSAAIATAAIVLVLWRRRPHPEEFALSRAAARRGATWWRVAGAVVACTLIATGAGLLLDALGITARASNSAPIASLHANHPVATFLLAVVMAPLYEELLFRRVLCGRLVDAGLPRAAIIASAVLFATSHELPGMGDGPWLGSLVIWCAYVLIGTAFGALYVRTGTLAAPVAAHALHNAVAYAGLMASTGAN
jgi:membrane protease YdiL (CAAX protease family)